MAFVGSAPYEHMRDGTFSLKMLKDKFLLPCLQYWTKL